MQGGMAPGNRPEDSETSTDEPNRDSVCPRSNPFVNFRQGVDKVAASIFTDLTEAFPSLQNYVPPQNSTSFSEWAHDAFRRFNDSYERATNPERKRIERMSCYDDGREINPQEHGHDMGRRWIDRRDSPVSLDRDRASHGDISAVSVDRRRASEEGSSQESHTARSQRLGTTMLDVLQDSGLFVGSLFDPWRPSVEYLRFSDYSPLQLEREGASEHWRDAFEDLLRLDHDLPRRNTAATRRIHRETGIEYANKLASEGMLSESGGHSSPLRILGLPSTRSLFELATDSFADISSAQDRRDAIRQVVFEEQTTASSSGQEQQEETELDAYLARDNNSDMDQGYHRSEYSERSYRDEEGNEHRFQEFSPTRQAGRVKVWTFTRSAQAAENHGAELMRETQTTESQILPDGSRWESTTTKTRFSDGSEHTTTSETTVPFQASLDHAAAEEDDPAFTTSVPIPPNQQRQGKIAEAVKEHQRKTEKENGGWFWSSK